MQRFFHALVINRSSSPAAVFGLTAASFRARSLLRATKCPVASAIRPATNATSRLSATLGRYAQVRAETNFLDVLETEHLNSSCVR
jgi:hypothetical protein